MSTASTATPDYSIGNSFSAEVDNVADPSLAPVESAPAEVQPLDTPRTPPPEVAPAVEEALPAEEEQAEGEPTDIPADLPEGVELIERNGQKLWAMPEESAKALHASVDRLAALENVSKQDLTPEYLEQRELAFERHNQMMNDLVSQNPNAQGRFIEKGLFAAAMNVMEKTGVDPLAGFVSQLADKLAVHPDSGAFIHLRNTVLDHFLPAITPRLENEGLLSVLSTNEADPLARMRDAIVPSLLRALMVKGHLAGDENGEKLMAAVQWVEGALYNGRFTKMAEVPPLAASQPSPERARLRQIEARENSLWQSEQRQAAAEWAGWQAGAKKASADAILTEIEAIFQPLAKDYEKFPEKAGELKAKLNQAVIEQIKADKIHLGRVSGYWNTAESDPASREQARDHINQLYRTAAKRILSAVAPKISKEISASFKAASDAQHKRLEAAAGRKAPGSHGAPLRKSLMPETPLNASAESWAAEVDRTLAG